MANIAAARAASALVEQASRQTAHAKQASKQASKGLLCFPSSFSYKGCSELCALTLEPNEKNSAVLASLFAVSAPRGTCSTCLVELDIRGQGTNLSPKCGAQA